jgi:Ca2+-binding RTX toxin-like protein
MVMMAVPCMTVNVCQTAKLAQPGAGKPAGPPSQLADHPYNRKMTRSRTLMVLAGLAAILATTSATPASAAATCSFNAGTVTIDLPAATATTIERFGQGIQVDGTLCGSAKLSTTSTIDVNGAAGTGAQSVTVKLTGGPFTPGLGGGDIVFNVNLTATGANSLKLVGAVGNDNIAVGNNAGTDEVNLNAGGVTADINLTGATSVQFNGGTGNDTFTGQGGAGTGAAATTAMTVIGGPGNDTITGGDGTETIDPGLGTDTVTGGAGDDTIISSPGGDHIDGGGAATVNTYDATFESAPVTVNLTTGVTSGTSIGTGTIANVSRVRGSAFADTITGSANADSITGYLGNDILSGLGGNDSINGGGGNDVINGGTGSNTLNGYTGNDTFVQGGGTDTINGGSGGESNTIDYSKLAGPITVDLTAGTDSAGDSLIAVQNVIGTAGGDSITGDGHPNIVHGLGGNDTISTAAGNDTIDAGAGTNVVDGGTGSNDTIDYSSAASGVNVDIGAGTGTGTGIWDTLMHIESIRGSIHNDVLTGNALPNVISGNLGNDTINAGSGNDIINEGTAVNGADAIFGGPGTDTVTYAGRHGDLRISLDGVANDGGSGEGDNVHTDVENVIAGAGNDHVMGNKFDNSLNGGGGINTVSFLYSPRGVSVNLTTQVASNWGHDTMVNFRNIVGSQHDDRLTGNALGNAILGEGGNDSLFGLAGNDALIGGSGNDHMNGGSGTDYCNGGTGTNTFLSC